MVMTGREFLIKEGILASDCTEFIISFDDGRSVELCKLLDRFGYEPKEPLIIIEEFEKPKP
jgi:hypothetical protein